ncbi:MAG: hypothetical protein KF822_06100 [Steroidobacteraceae bacterium]|nr:hypothetical protein [Steroidobacteraceae bacterium]
MSARAVLRWLSGVLVTLGLIGLIFRFLDSSNQYTLTAPLVLLGFGFAGVMALFLKDELPKP